MSKAMKMMQVYIKVIVGMFMLFTAVMVGMVAFADAPAVPAPAVPGGTAAAEVAAQTAQQPGGIMAFVPFILMFAVLYFLVLRPQQKKVKEQQAMLAALKHGDDVVTASGLLGKVTGITDKVVTLEVADDVRVKMLKSQVTQVIKGSVKDLVS